MTSGQNDDAVSTRFGVILSVGNGRLERSDVVAAEVTGGVDDKIAGSGDVTGLDFAIFGVVEDEVVVEMFVDEIDEVVVLLSLCLLKRDLIAFTTFFV